MWLSLIWTKLNRAELCWRHGGSGRWRQRVLDVGTPPAMVQSRPVPAQAMQLRKLRRSIPSLAGVSWRSHGGGCFDADCRCARACVRGIRSWVNPPRMQTAGRDGFLFPMPTGINLQAIAQFHLLESRMRKFRTDDVVAVEACGSRERSARTPAFEELALPSASVALQRRLLALHATPPTRRTWCRRHF